jgi:2-dehydro-3-deoxygalactonokinase
MVSSQNSSEGLCAIYIDMGTTNTRAWLMCDRQILARVSEPVGVRDAARDGPAGQIRATLRKLTVKLRSEFTLSSCTPMCIAAAGMIGSPLGLAEIPHVPAPAGFVRLAASSRWFQFPEVSELPILVVPGVRSGPERMTIDTIHQTDVMRGEETLCVGLHTLGLVRVPGIVLSLGSHWKAIRLDADGCVERSVTSLSGELVHAAQMQTILASSVLRERPGTISQEWTEAGMREQRRSGLARALFCVRLLELAGQGTPEDRLAFMIGAFLATDLDKLVRSGMFLSDLPVVVVGPAALAEAWRKALTEASVSAKVVAPDSTEAALLEGLRRILVEACRESPIVETPRAQL